MNYYETLYIVHSALEAGRLKDIVSTVEKSLKENGGEVVTTEVWGKKKLGYYIDKQKYGTYILIQFKSDGTKNNNFNLQMEHNPSILAYMTVKIEEDAIREQTEDLDAQIAGKEAKVSRSVPVIKEVTSNDAEESKEEPVSEEIASDDAEESKEEPVSEEVTSDDAEESKEEPVSEEVTSDDAEESKEEPVNKEKVEG
jgi:small subunit ribosomal protein S6